MTTADRRKLGLVLVVACALALGRCGGGGGSSGGGPTVPVVPPAPTPTPGPTPEPPISQSCTKLPPGSLSAQCGTDVPDFQGAVDEAIRTLQAEQPAMFDGDLVLSVGAFYVGLVKGLDRKGLCAATEGEEVGVAGNSSYNEQYDVLSAQNRLRFGPVSYRLTCRPSAVPITHGALPPPAPGCPLASSREVACGRDPVGNYYDDVEAAISQVLKEKPELFDFTDTAPGTNFPAVKDMAAYEKALFDSLIAKGYCVTGGGEEIALKKGSNVLSEQYDINIGDKYVRRGPGIYRLTCYPAAF